MVEVFVGFSRWKEFSNIRIQNSLNDLRFYMVWPGVGRHLWFELVVVVGRHLLPLSCKICWPQAVSVQHLFVFYLVRTSYFPSIRFLRDFCNYFISLEFIFLNSVFRLFFFRFIISVSFKVRFVLAFSFDLSSLPPWITFFFSFLEFHILTFQFLACLLLPALPFQFIPTRTNMDYTFNCFQ